MSVGEKEAAVSRQTREHMSSVSFCDSSWHSAEHLCCTQHAQRSLPLPFYQQAITGQSQTHTQSNTQSNTPTPSLHHHLHPPSHVVSLGLAGWPETWQRRLVVSGQLSGQLLGHSGQQQGAAQTQTQPGSCVLVDACWVCVCVRCIGCE